MGETDRGVALPWTLSALVVTDLDSTFKYPADNAKHKTHKQRYRRSAALCAIDPEHPLHLLDARPVRPGDVTGDREAPAPHDLLEAGTRRVGVGIHAEDEAALRRDDVGEQMVDELAATARRNGFQPGAHAVEAQGRRPGERVADEDAVGPPWQTRAGERGELRDDVEPIRPGPGPLRRTPLHDRLHD